MDIKLAYGKDGIIVRVPGGVQADTFGRTEVDNPITYPQFVDALKKNHVDRLLGLDPPPLVVVNDGHRPTPTPQILEWLDKFAPGFLNRARIVVACGTHGQPSPEHLDKIFGRFLERLQGRYTWHDCNDLGSVVKVGVDHFGKDVFVNRAAVDATRVLIVTSSEPHYFAGFTGGRKSFFPGLADRATIERNHNLANSLDCAPLRLKGNPMAEHLKEMLGLLDVDKLFSIQLVVDAGRRIGSIFCDRIDRAFAEAVRASRALYETKVDYSYDLVLAEILPPLDKSLYQIQKGLENTQSVVRDGGTVAVVADCHGGVGQQSFVDLASLWDRAGNRPLDGVAHFGSHKLSRVNAMTRRIDVRLKSELPPHIPRQVYYEPVDDLQELVDAAGSRGGARMAVVHDAAHTVLQLKSVTESHA